MKVRIACVVEGHGEVSAVPVLIRRLANSHDPQLHVHIPQPIRVSRDKMLRTGELERAVELASRKARHNGGVLVLIDAHGACPAELGPQLLQRATQHRKDLLIAVVVAKQEYESWFLAAAESIRGRRGLRDDFVAPTHPEDIRGAKERLSAAMAGGRKYVETLDQPALTQLFAIEQARRNADSLDKFCREVVQLIEACRQAPPPSPT